MSSLLSRICRTSAHVGRRWHAALLAGALAVICCASVAPASAATFSNSSPITIPAFGRANPYPSTIDVSGVTADVTDVDVTLNRVTHRGPEDLDVLLVGPGGQNLMIMSDSGFSFDDGGALDNVDITLDDQASNSLPSGTDERIRSGRYKPTDNGNVPDVVADPAPDPSSATQLSTFNAVSPNGAWSLWIFDDRGYLGGVMNGGWTLSITTAPPASPPTGIVGAVTGTIGAALGGATVPPAAPLAVVARPPAARQCASQRQVTLRLPRRSAGGRDLRGARIVAAELVVSGRSRAQDFGRTSARIDLRGLPKGRYVARIRVRQRNGATFTLKRAYGTCRAKPTR